MGKLFSNMTTEGTEEVEDRIGGAGRKFFETNVYENATLKMLFFGKSKNGASFGTVILDIAGTEYEETIYFTNAKGSNTYEKDGKKNQMPGFVTINELCMTVTGQELSDQETEERQIEVYDFEKKAKVRQARDVAVDMLGQPCSVAIRQSIKYKQEDDGTGKWVDTDKEVTYNEIVKSFHPETRATVGEIKKAQKDGKEIVADFIDAWAERWKGTVNDTRKGTPKKSSGGSTGAPKSGGDAAKPKTSLFAKKD